MTYRRPGVEDPIFAMASPPLARGAAVNLSRFAILSNSTTISYKYLPTCHKSTYQYPRDMRDRSEVAQMTGSVCMRSGSFRRRAAAAALVAAAVGGASAASAAGYVNYWPTGALAPNNEAVGSIGSYQVDVMYCNSGAQPATVRYSTTGGSIIRSVASSSCTAGGLSTGMHPTESSVKPRCWNRAITWMVGNCFAYKP